MLEKILREIPLLRYFPLKKELEEKKQYIIDNCEIQKNKDKLVNSIDKLSKDRHLADLNDLADIYIKYMNTGCCSEIIERFEKSIYEGKHPWEKDIKVFGYHEWVKTIETFDGTPEIDSIFEIALSELMKEIESYHFARSIRDCKETFENFGNYKFVNKSIISVVMFGKVPNHVIAFYKRNIHKQIDKAAQIIWRNAPMSKKNIKHFTTLVMVLEKYIDHLDVFGKVPLEVNKHSDLRELYMDATFEKIINSNKPNELVKRILSNNYSEIKGKINATFEKELNYDDLDKLNSCYQLVKGIHKDRKQGDMWKIDEGFFGELNRALSQGYYVKDRKKLFHQYCNEVSAKMRENAHELMVVNNA